jgi:hypothetical protein
LFIYFLVASIAVVTVAPTNAPTNPTVAPTVPVPTSSSFGSPTSSGVDNNGNGGSTYDGLSAGAVIGIKFF